MLHFRNVVFVAIAAAVVTVVASLPVRAQVTLMESGFTCTLLSDDLAKQVEIGVGPDTCLYYGSFDGLKRRCAPSDPGTICDPNLTFPVGVAFSTGGTFGSFMYIADFGAGGIWRSSGCSAAAPFATLDGPGAIAFPPAASPYGNFLYACVAFDGPIVRVSSTGTVTNWVDLETTYLRFGPGGVWGTGLYATITGMPGTSGIVKVSSTGVVTPLVSDFVFGEGFDWGFDGDLFATDMSAGEILRVKSNGTSTVFATLSGAADIAYRPGEKALYVVSNQGGLYRIVRGATTGVVNPTAESLSLTVAPNPARGACSLRFQTPTSGIARVHVVDVSGRLVRRFGGVWRPAGLQSMTWDGRDETGALVPAGTYFARVLAAGEARSTRVTIVR